MDDALWISAACGKKIELGHCRVKERYKISKSTDVVGVSRQRNIISINEILKSYVKYILCAVPFFAITYGINYTISYKNEQ